MKKLSVVFVTVLLLMLSTICFASAYDYGVDEAEFDIPDGFSVFYDEEYMPVTEVFRFIAEDNSVELSCYYLENRDEASFFFMNLTDVVEYFFDNISAFDYSDFTFGSAQTYHLYRSGDGIMFEGTVEKSGSIVPIETYVFSTERNIYGFQFLIYNESGHGYIDEIVASLNISDYNSGYEADVPSTDGPDFISIAYFVILVFTILAFIFRFFGNNKKNKAEATADNKPVPVRSKTELNGKNINKFSAKRSGIYDGDNFALKELERERKERENMFK